jgi:hypothetical protein
MSELEQNLLFAASGIILLGTLVVFLWQWWSNRDRD